MKKFYFNISVIKKIDYFLKTFKDVNLIKELVFGFGRLFIRSTFSSDIILSRLILMYFDAETKLEIRHLICNFFQALIESRKQHYLSTILMNVILQIMNSSVKSSINKISIEDICTFVISKTKSCCENNVYCHDAIAEVFLQTIFSYPRYSKLSSTLSEELLSLDISDNIEVKNNLKTWAQPLLTGKYVNKRRTECIVEFIEYLDTGDKAESINKSKIKIVPIPEVVSIFFEYAHNYMLRVLRSYELPEEFTKNLAIAQKELEHKLMEMIKKCPSKKKYLTRLAAQRMRSDSFDDVEMVVSKNY